ncbi:Uncharacterised protein [Mycobacteroides abscessus subsp. abscessus]|nr:Uncharacterised protein [Mycobacteroides abscessus subsp. abscessus]
MRDREVEPVDAGIVEAGVDRCRVLPGIDDEARPVAEVDHGRRPLTDIADEHEPIPRRSPRTAGDDDGRSEGDDEGDDGDSPQASAHE